MDRSIKLQRIKISDLSSIGGIVLIDNSGNKYNPRLSYNSLSQIYLIVFEDSSLDTGIVKSYD